MAALGILGTPGKLGRGTTDRLDTTGGPGAVGSLRSLVPVPVPVGTMGLLASGTTGQFLSLSLERRGDGSKAQRKLAYAGFFERLVLHRHRNRCGPGLKHRDPVRSPPRPTFLPDRPRHNQSDHSDHSRTTDGDPHKLHSSVLA